MLLNIYLSDYNTWCTNAYLRIRCTSLLFTRSVHQPPAYKALTNQGEAYQYIDYVVCFDIEASHHPNKHTILHVFRARGYDSIVLLSWYKHY